MAKSILHMLTPLAHMSPFDINMAADAGFDVVATYTNVSLAEVSGLTQDAMFSRSPRDALRTGMFIAGKDAFIYALSHAMYLSTAVAVAGVVIAVTLIRGKEPLPGTEPFFPL